MKYTVSDNFQRYEIEIIEATANTVDYLTTKKEEYSCDEFDIEMKEKTQFYIISRKNL